MDLTEIRKEIDAIDDQLVRLFIQRMDCSRRVAEYKKANNLPIYVPAREQAILENLAEKAGPELAEYIQPLYSLIFELSRNYQNKKNASKCGLLGRRLGHSYSPQIHAALGSYSYTLFEKEPEELEDFLRSGDFTGINVTIPYKKAVIPYLDELSPTARTLGAVNTIVRRSDGTLYGHNTDAFGFRSMVECSGLALSGRKCLVLGSGGAGSMAAAVLTELGAEAVIISRSGENNYENLDFHADAVLIVNATPVGMFPNNGESPVDLSLFPNLEGVLDLIYNPARTQLLLDAEARGIPNMNGLWMLVAQAKEAAEYFTGCAISDDVIANIHAKLRRQMENIILVGMPGCGKSTVGAKLAKALSKTFIDSDNEIAALSLKTIPEIFIDEGEKGFRAWETEAIGNLGKRSGLVIATGGGCVTCDCNYPLLHQNGTIFWLERSLDVLPTDGRPLSQKDRLGEMYAVRKPMYAHFADHIIDNNGPIEETVRQILNILEEN